MSAADLFFDKTKEQLSLKGYWTVVNIESLKLKLSQLTQLSLANLKISGAELEAFDTAAALLLTQYLNQLSEKGQAYELFDFSSGALEMIQLIKDNQALLEFKASPGPKRSFLYRLGEESIAKILQADGLVVLVGDLSSRLFEALLSWRRFRFSSIVANIDSTGIKALPIIALLSFLIGVVLAYQMGLQLQTYGANIFIAYLSGMAIFREFSPLITAIIVAGRTSSAFTAQLGSMKINEEVDALLTMGLSPTEFLVLPKVLALLFIFPLLIFWSDLFGVLGAMIMSKSMLGIPWSSFLERLHDSVGFVQLRLGLYKAPAFALLIALVGCFQGFRVEFNADSLGSQTTKSVVQALFLIIIADAAYSVIYSWMGL